MPITTKKETNEQLAILERWLAGEPIEEQRLIDCVKTAIHLAKLYIRDGQRSSK